MNENQDSNLTEKEQGCCCLFTIAYLSIIGAVICFVLYVVTRWALGDLAFRAPIIVEVFIACICLLLFVIHVPSRNRGDNQ
jgi:hypothetical protein